MYQSSEDRSRGLRWAIVWCFVGVSCGSPDSATSGAGGDMTSSSSAGTGASTSTSSSSTASTSSGATCDPVGLDDAEVHAPPASGPFAYNGFTPPLSDGAS